MVQKSNEPGPFIGPELILFQFNHMYVTAIYCAHVTGIVLLVPEIYGFLFSHRIIGLGVFFTKVRTQIY